MLRCVARHAAFLATARLKSYVAATQVYHDPLKRKFIVQLFGNDRGFVAYKPLGENIWHLFYTEVPPVYRRLGVGSVMAAVVMDHCAANDIKVKITCSFLVRYYLAHQRPEYVRIVLEPKIGALT